MECNFHVGQEVICINDDPFAPPNIQTARGELDGLTAGNHYTVGSIYMDHTHDIPCITVLEIYRGKNYISGQEYGYFAFRFRPLQKKSTDISALKKLLQPLDKKKVLEDV